MKPKHVVNISINSETPAEHLSDLERKVIEQQYKAWLESGQSVPDAVREKARQMGIEVEECAS